jgi:uncharacterized protein (DUF305 family)
VQAQEIEQMRAWYRQWYGMEVPNIPMMSWQPGNGMMGGGMMNGRNMMGTTNMMYDDVEALNNAIDFDRAFITLMVPHHRMAVMMSNMVLMGGEHQQLRHLARSIISSQSAEIERMEEWYTTWFGQ